jgi:hypothetical protein
MTLESVLFIEKIPQDDGQKPSKKYRKATVLAERTADEFYQATYGKGTLSKGAYPKVPAENLPLLDLEIELPADVSWRQDDLVATRKFVQHGDDFNCWVEKQ